MPDYVEFFLDAPKSVAQIETLEISHPDFSRTYYLARSRKGFEAGTEDSGSVEFERMPMRVRRLSSRADLDYGIGVDLGDLGEIIPQEIDRVRDAGSFGLKPEVVHRVYRSDDLSAPMLGPMRLEAQAISMTRQGATFEAVAPRLNLNKTGELYTIDRFAPLRGFL